VTHDYIGYLAKRLVLEMRGLLVLGHPEVDGNEFIRDVALFGYHGHFARAGRQRCSVKYDWCHG